jgi:hypothetical protein
MRSRIVFDRLPLTGMGEGFGSDNTTAILQRWPIDHENDSDDTDPLEIRRRPPVQVVRFADYDHDGRATEFYLQTEAVPCGKSAGVVVGISKANPRLHVFGTAREPDKPLYLLKREWEALRDAAGPVDVVDWRCGDHGADTQTVVHLSWTAAGIDGRRREYACVDDQPGRLISDEPL